MFPLTTGQPLDDALAKKFGPQAGALMQRVTSAGQADGATFADWKWRANTVKGAIAALHAPSSTVTRACQAAGMSGGGCLTCRSHARGAGTAARQEPRGQPTAFPEEVIAG
jgi:hypothetical protein